MPLGKTQMTLVVATDLNGTIGKDNELIWHLPNDLKRFKELTTGHPVIMGRKTFDSIFDYLKKPLPNRTNIVVSRNRDYQREGIVIANGLEEAINKAQHLDQEIFVIGGAEIYKQCLSLASKIELTLVKDSFDGDVYFPKINLETWEEVRREEHTKDEKHAFAYDFLSYKRKGY